MNKFAARLSAAVMAAAVGVSALPTVYAEDNIKYEYGVFLSAKGEEALKKFESYRIVVLDAQFYTESEIKKLKDNGHTVYSYINLGSIEDDRPYYNDYKGITFAPYEDWPKERWVDVSTDKWYDFQTGLAQDLLDKGIDGFFVDNTDVYYVAKEQKDTIDVDMEITPQKIFGGVEKILKGYKKLETRSGESPYVLINGGDTFVFDYLDGVDPADTDDNDEPYGFYLNGHSDLNGVIDGINQEAVFGEIDFEADPDNLRVFTEQSGGDSKWYKDYCEKVKSVGKDVYLLEYTDDENIMKQAADYSNKHGFTYFATDRGLLTIDATEKGSMPVNKDKLKKNDSSKTEASSSVKDSASSSKTEETSSSVKDSASSSKSEERSSSVKDSASSSKSEERSSSVKDSASSSKSDGAVTITVKKGDADLSGEVNVTDIAVIAAHIKGIKALNENGFKAADVDNDGVLTVSDIAAVAAHIKGIKALV